MNRGRLQKILIVDDHSTNRLMLYELFKDSYTVLLAKNGPMALQLAHKHAPDLVLLDVVMPEVNGYEVLAGLKMDGATRDIPVIFITALEDENFEERGLLLGAADYITKPFHPPVVRARVENHMQAVRQRQLLERYAMFDPLTELPNRRRLQLALEAQFKPGTAVSMAMLDIDHFKHFNDRYGHVCGDRALRELAQVLRHRQSGEHDLAARYGGEEFLLWLPGSDSEAARSVAEDVRAQVADLQIDHPEGPLRMTVSIGGASAIIGANGALPTDLLEAADGQLYIAKQGGRNRVSWCQLSAN